MYSFKGEEKEYKKLQEIKEKAAQEQLNIRMRELEKERQNKAFNAVGSDTMTIGSSSITPSISISQSVEENEPEVKEEQASESKTKKKKQGKVKGM